MRISRATACALVLLLPAAASCGGGADDSSLLADLAADAPAEQRAAFDDDNIDFAEYEAAVDRTVSCLIDHGYPSKKVPDPLGLFSIAIDGASSSDEADAEYDRCSYRYKTQIEVAYSRLHPPPPATTSTTVP